MNHDYANLLYLRISKVSGKYMQLNDWRLSVARQIETVVEKALARASRLRQAVLKSAFEGKLV